MGKSEKENVNRKMTKRREEWEQKNENGNGEIRIGKQECKNGNEEMKMGK